MRKTIALALMAAFTMIMSPGVSHGDLILSGILDGDLPGGIPKAFIITVENDIADLSTFGIGVANNGGGSDGQEFTFSGSATAGDVIVVTSNTDGATFFSDNFLGVTTIVNGIAGVNGDDAVELYSGGAVIDTYGDVALDGTNETWEYQDGYGLRTGGTAGTFNQSNWDSVDGGFDGLDEDQHVEVISAVFSFETIPEPGSASALALIAGLGMLRRRR